MVTQRVRGCRVMFSQEVIVFLNEKLTGLGDVIKNNFAHYAAGVAESVRDETMDEIVFEELSSELIEVLLTTFQQEALRAQVPRRKQRRTLDLLDEITYATFFFRDEKLNIVIDFFHPDLLAKFDMCKHTTSFAVPLLHRIH